QVFGQTPIYSSSLGLWELWPELPPALLAWLEKHRLPHFCKSSLCLHLVLCQKLLGFIRSGEAAKLLNWQSADRWLLEKCISGSQGMWCFRAFVQGMAGEELIDFWLTTERLLGLDESDARQRDLYLTLLHRLEATHLREGSSVITLCRTIVGKNMGPISTRREILSKMQEQALFIIQSYWLPKFFIHCKKSMEEEKSCWPLLQEYQERLLWASSQEPANLQEPSSFLENLFTMHVKKTPGLSGPYCSKKAKAEIWTLVKEGKDTQEMKTPSFQVQPERQPGPTGSTKASRLDKGLIPQQLEPNGKDICEGKVLSNLHSSILGGIVQLPSLEKLVKTLSFLPWALRAESCAGRPFRDFLKHQDQSMETCLLDLWHDLEEFLPVALDANRENSFFLRHLIGEKICKTYLEDSTIQQLPLETRTLRILRGHLKSGEFSPWIFRAQNEICKVLCRFYEEFLADDDRTFLQFMVKGRHRGHGHLCQAVGKDECFLLSQRINASLKLSQALHGTRNMEGLSSEHWRLMAACDLRKGGSIHTEAEPVLRRIGRNQPCSVPTATEPKSRKKRTSVRKNRSSTTNSITGVAEKPSRRPRHFVKVLHNPAHLQYFKQFLEERNADKPLRFWMDVENLASETNPKTKSSLIDSSDRTSLPEEQLDCHSSIIKEIREAKVVSPFMLLTAQILVQKAMEKRCPVAAQTHASHENPKVTGSNCYKRISLWTISHKYGATTDRDCLALAARVLVSEQDPTCPCRFSRLADSAEALAAHNRQTEKEVAFLKKKAAIISKLFLNSDIPPKLVFLRGAKLLLLHSHFAQL
uniref:Regulator of G protein signaling like 1 n=1 Tax=Calidris pygmaea TaxID=425635 RepID=A0A8C3JRB0_9CHAR